MTPMSGLLLVRGARQLLTLRGSSGPRRGPALRELGLIPDGALLIREGAIVAVGPSRRVENLAEARAAREIDASGRVVLPGFVDSHTHLVAGPARVPEADGPSPPVTGEALRAVPATRLRLEARRLLAALLRHGTTTLEAKSGASGDQTGELKILRVLAALNERPLEISATCLVGRRLPLEHCGKPDDYEEWMCARLLPKIRRRRLARFVDVTCSPGGLTAAHASRCLETARRLGFRLKAHAEQASHDGLARLAVEHGASSADHLTYAKEEDVRLLAASNTVATLLPGADGPSGAERLPPARALIDAGAAVDLATGFNPESPSPYSMQMVTALACSRLGMSAAEAVAAGTINGAHALGVAERVGSLETGKQADLLVLDAPDYRDMAYHSGGNLVALVLKRGEVLYRQGGVKWPED